MNLEFWTKVREDYNANPYGTTICYCSPLFSNKWHNEESRNIIMEYAREYLQKSSYAGIVEVEDDFLFSFLKYKVSAQADEANIRTEFLNYMVLKKM